MAQPFIVPVMEALADHLKAVAPGLGLEADSIVRSYAPNLTVEALPVGSFGR